jgi:hypothetical protein
LQKGEDFVKVCLSLLGAFNIQVAIEQSTNWPRRSVWDLMSLILLPC